MPLGTQRGLDREGWSIERGYMGKNITTASIPYTDFELGPWFEVQIPRPRRL